MEILKTVLFLGLLASTCFAEWFVGTNEFGHMLATTSRSDFEGRYNFVTSAVMPYVEVDPTPHRIIEEGIEIPSFVLTNETTGVGFEFRVNRYGQLVGGVTNHASPRRPKAAIDADFEKLEGGKSNRLTRIERIYIDLQQVNAQIEGTNWVDVVLTGISTTAGTWSNANQRATITAIKSALQATKDREQNLKVAVRNLMQATEKVRKEIEP